VWLEESGQLFGVPFRADMAEVPEDFFLAGNASVKRELLTRAGRFDERYSLHAGDDFEFGKRLRAAGMRAQFVPDARAALSGQTFREAAQDS
jgi:GT2 family glycosyltransferase